MSGEGGKRERLQIWSGTGRQEAEPDGKKLTGQCPCCAKVCNKCEEHPYHLPTAKVAKGNEVLQRVLYIKKKIKRERRMKKAADKVERLIEERVASQQCPLCRVNPSVLCLDCSDGRNVRVPGAYQSSSPMEEVDLNDQLLYQRPQHGSITGRSSPAILQASRALFSDAASESNQPPLISSRKPTRRFPTSAPCRFLNS